MEKNSKDAREVLKELLKSSIEDNDEYEYEDMICEDRLTGSIEIMRRKIEKSE
jgi:hypothetical protein